MVLLILTELQLCCNTTSSTFSYSVVCHKMTHTGVWLKFVMNQWWRFIRSKPDFLLFTMTKSSLIIVIYTDDKPCYITSIRYDTYIHYMIWRLISIIVNVMWPGKRMIDMYSLLRVSDTFQYKPVKPLIIIIIIHWSYFESFVYFISQWSGIISLCHKESDISYIV